ncbi:MAG: hypothetical protein P4L35_10195 [Ignavibacteriaceae bacterium]|nr:hypothetical protein [Ignavibacteriaceae bacterium]
MSWLFGFYSKQLNNVPSISKYHPEPVSSYHNSNCIIAVGGNENLLNYQTGNNQIKFFICGLGISANADSFLCVKEWDKLLLTSSENISKQNGHYCGVQINDDSISLFTDPMGLRVIHIAENNEGWFFSTRLDWILKTGAFEIDFPSFSSRWLLFNQVSTKSIVKKIINLNCGSKAYISNYKIGIKSNFWVPEKTKDITLDEFRHNLNKFILLGAKQNKHISLSLSGGLDSRVLLSLLINSDYKNWDCHLFKSESLMDNVIAAKILNDHNIPYRLFSPAAQNESDKLNYLFEYIGSTYISESAYTSQKLTHYSNLSQNDLIIDGAFGEMWRREFLTRLYLAGPKIVEGKNLTGISNAIKFNRADIFNQDTLNEMHAGINNQLNDIIDLLPPVKEIGFGNWLDLFSLKTRLVTYMAPEQARLDNFVTSYMPYIQFTLLNDLLNMPLSLRKNHRLFNKLFYPQSVDLTKYKLVKGNVPYPFYFNPVMKRVYSIAYSKFAPKEKNNGLDLFLEGMKEFIMDSVSSSEVRSYSPYNYENIANNINSYYNGHSSKSDYVNWFLTFEIFRQILQKTSISPILSKEIPTVIMS